MHGAADAARMGVRLHRRSGGNAVRGVGSKGTGEGCTRAATAVPRVFTPPRRGGIPFTCQNSRQIRLGHTCAVWRLRFRGRYEYLKPSPPPPPPPPPSPFIIVSDHIPTSLLLPWTPIESILIYLPSISHKRTNFRQIYVVLVSGR